MALRSVAEYLVRGSAASVVRPAVVTAVILAVVVGSAPSAQAQNGCDPGTVLSSVPLGGLTTLTSFNDGVLRTNPANDGGTWYAYGSTIGRFWTSPAGHAVTTSPTQAQISIGTPVAAAPAIVRMWDNYQAAEYDTLSAIIVGANGFVYRYDLAPTVNSFTFKWSFDTKRRTALGGYACAAGDTLIAPPSVYLWEYRSAASQAGHTAEDIVMVSTRYGCGATSVNQVIALSGQTGTELWRTSSGLQLDFGTSVVPDYTTDALYATFSALMMAQQPTLIRVPILSTGTAQIVWAGNHGDLRSPARIMQNGELFFISYNGTLRVVRASDGYLLALQPLTSTANFLEAPYIITGTAGGRAVYSKDSSGFVHGDTVGVGGSPLTQIFAPFKPNNVNASAAPSVDAYRNKLFVPAVNGVVYQFDIATAAPTAFEASFTIGSGTTLTPALALESNNPAEQINRLSVVSATSGSTSVVKNVCGPAGLNAGGGLPSRSGEDSELGVEADAQSSGTNCTNDGQCTAARWNGPCTTGKCVYVAKNGYSDVYGALKGVCVGVPKAANTACSDSRAGCLLNSNEGRCIAGVCQPDPTKYALWSDTCSCTVSGIPGLSACPPPSGATVYSCCGGTGCKDLATDEQNCGACGFVCDVGFLCRSGTCVEPWCDGVVSATALNGKVTNGTSGKNLWAPVGASFVRSGAANNTCGIDVAVGKWGSNPGAVVRYDYPGSGTPEYYPSKSGWHMTHVAADRSGKVSWASSVEDLVDGNPASGLKMLYDQPVGTPSYMDYDVNGGPASAYPFTSQGLNRGFGQITFQNMGSNLTDDHPPFRAYWGNGGAAGTIAALDWVWSTGSNTYVIKSGGMIASIAPFAGVRTTAIAYAQVRQTMCVNEVCDHGHIDRRLYFSTEDATGPRFYYWCGAITNPSCTTGNCATNCYWGDEIPVEIDLGTAFWTPNCNPPGSLNCSIPSEHVTKIYSIAQSAGDAIVTVKWVDKFAVSHYDAVVVKGTDLSVRPLNSVLEAYGQPTLTFTGEMTAAAISDYGMLIKVPTNLPTGGCAPSCSRTGDEAEGDGAAPLALPPQPSPIDQTASPITSPFMQFWLRPYVVPSPWEAIPAPPQPPSG